MNASNDIIIRVRMPNNPQALSDLLSAIANMDAQVGPIDLIKITEEFVTRDITLHTNSEAHMAEVSEQVSQLEGVELRHVADPTVKLHLGGKITVQSKITITHRDELSMAYTPGVARICNMIAENRDKARQLTIKNNLVGIITDGSAVLGLGNIGPEAALPVMEGKAMLLKEFADVDGFPICLNTQDPDEIVETVKRIAPVFGAINLEDIAAPQCFDIEKRLKAELDIPVFHDDQHGTAAVMTAAFINALKLVKKAPEEVKVVFNGVGAAGNACKNMLLNLGVKHIIGCDRNGILSSAREDLNSAKQAYLADTNPHDVAGTVYDAIVDADVFVGLSAPNILSVEDIKKMNSDAIVFAMANPTPEIMPEIALPHVAIMATGRSDYPNQINNLLAFPGIFRGTLDAGATDINDAMNLAAAKAIAELIEDADLAPDYIVPSVFNPEVAKRVAQAVKDAARESGIARH